MSEELTVKTRTKISQKSRKCDILSLYGVPTMLDQVVAEEKMNLLNKLECGSVVIDALGHLNSEDFIIEIPSELREMLKTGKASFDKSNKNPGAFTPNIRIKGEAGIKGQAYIVKKVDCEKITKSLSNLAMLAMVQSILEKIDAIEEKIEDVRQGQKNDRIGTIIGAFKSFMDLYPTFKSVEEMNAACNAAYLDMQEGLAQLHMQIDAERKKLNEAPHNHFQTLLMLIKHPLRSNIEYFQNYYKDYVFDIQLYNRLILLSDIILYLKGSKEEMRKNHDNMVNYCNQYISVDFRSKMNYLTNGKTPEIDQILEYNKNLDIVLNSVKVSDIKIECKINDVKYLNRKRYESEKC